MQIWDRQRCKSSGQGLKVLLLLTVPPGLSRGLPHATGCQREPRRGTWSCELLRAGDSCRPGKKAERQAPKCEGKQIHGRFVPKGTKASLETVLSWLITENHSLGTSALLQLRKRQKWPKLLGGEEAAGAVTGGYSRCEGAAGSHLPLGIKQQNGRSTPCTETLPPEVREMQLKALLGFLQPFPEEKPHFRHFRRYLGAWRESEPVKGATRRKTLSLDCCRTSWAHWVVPSQVRRKTGMARMFIHQRVNSSVLLSGGPLWVCFSSWWLSIIANLLCPCVLWHCSCHTGEFKGCNSHRRSLLKLVSDL